MGYEIIFYPLIFILLLGLSAFFSGSETAFFALSRSTIEKLRHSAVEKEHRVAELMENPRQLLITIIVGNTIVNITTASLAAILTHQLSIDFQFNPQIALVIDVVVVTFILLITSEIIPKVIAIRNAQQFSQFAGVPLKLLFHLFFPITFLLTGFTRFVQNTMGFSKDKIKLSEEELKDQLKTIAEVGEEHNVLEFDEKEMIRSIFEFGETTVKEIMIPRTDMVCIEKGASIEELMATVKSKLFSRIPVYEDRIDNIVGVLYLKDLLPFLNKKTQNQVDLKKLTRTPNFVPEQKMIDDLLREFQKERIHMALVVDEYGGVSGLVTLEDVIEEIVGEIQDEYDTEQPLYKKIDENTFIVDGRMPLEEINEELFLNLPTEEGVETISGFILSLLGSLPKEKETTRYNGYQFVVEQIKKNRILQVRIEKDLVPTNPEENSTSK